jgi:hypothetical protein
VVLLASYTYENLRRRPLSKSKPFPNGGGAKIKIAVDLSQDGCETVLLVGAGFKPALALRRSRENVGVIRTLCVCCAGAGLKPAPTCGRLLAET